MTYIIWHLRFSFKACTNKPKFRRFLFQLVRQHGFEDLWKPPVFQCIACLGIQRYLCWTCLEDPLLLAQGYRVECHTTRSPSKASSLQRILDVQIYGDIHYHTCGCSHRNYIRIFGTRLNNIFCQYSNIAKVNHITEMGLKNCSFPDSEGKSSSKLGDSNDSPKTKEATNGWSLKMPLSGFSRPSRTACRVVIIEAEADSRLDRTMSSTKCTNLEDAQTI